MNLFAEQKIDSQTLKNFWLPKGNRSGWWGERDALGAWDGNIVKLGCDNGCTTVNVVKIHLI